MLAKIGSFIYRRRRSTLCVALILMIDVAIQWLYVHPELNPQLTQAATRTAK